MKNWTVFDKYRELAHQQSIERLIEFGDESLSAASFWRLVRIKAQAIRLGFRKLFDRELFPGESIGLASTRSLHTPSDMLAILFDICS